MGTVIAPAPIAITVKAINAGLARPIDVSIGAIIPAVVVIATVDEPCAVFKIADSRKGNNKHGSKSSGIFFDIIYHCGVCNYITKNTASCCYDRILQLLKSH